MIRRQSPNRLWHGADAPPERVVRAAQGRPLAEGGHALVPGQGRGHLGLRPRDPGCVGQLQAARRSSACSAISRSSAGSITCRSRARTSTRATTTVPVLRRRVPDERAHVRPCRAGRAGRPQGLGKHRHVLRRLQPQEGRAHAGRSGHAPDRARRGGPTRRPPSASPSASGTRRRAGATTSTGTSSSTTPRPVACPRRTSRHPTLGSSSHAIASRVATCALRSHITRPERSRARWRPVTAAPAAVDAVAAGRVASVAAPAARVAAICRRHGRRRSARLLAPRAARVSFGARPAEGGRTPVRRRRRPGRDGSCSTSAIRSPPGSTRWTIRCSTRRQPVRDLQRRRGQQAPVSIFRVRARRHARAVRLGHRQSDVDGVRSRRAALRLQPLRRHRLRAAETDRPSRSRPIWAWRAGWRSRRTARCCRRSLGHDLPRRPAGRRRVCVACRRASRRFTWRSVPTGRSTSAARRSPRTIRVYRIER